MEELLDNLLFSATLPRLLFPLPDDPPTRSERIVHNAARRRLAERYGFKEYQPLVGRAEALSFVDHARSRLEVSLDSLRKTIQKLSNHPQ